MRFDGQKHEFSYREAVATHSPGLRSYPGMLPNQWFYPNGVVPISVPYMVRQIQFQRDETASR
jgi:hypothetical protein